MDGASLTRLRWRLRGAWMWPCFVVLTLADGAIAHRLPPLGDHESAVAGWLLGFIATLIAVVVLVPPLGWLLRRVRTDMPRVVARDYAGAGVCGAVTLALLAGGIAHHHVVSADRLALEDASARAEAYIGDHAPAPFLANLQHLNADPLQPPEIYRICVTNRDGTRDYCVVVDRSKPFGRSVRPDGSEPNSLLSQGTS